MREAEDQLKVIPQFCFPDAKDWAPVDNFPRSVWVQLLPRHRRQKKKRKKNWNKTGTAEFPGRVLNSSAVFFANNHMLEKKFNPL